MTNIYEHLVSKLEEGNQNFDPDEEDFRSALHDLAISDNFEGMRKLRDSYTKFNFRFYRNNFFDCSKVKTITQNKLDDYAREADETFGLKKFNEKLGYIQKFCREAISLNFN